MTNYNCELQSYVGQVREIEVEYYTFPDTHTSRDQFCGCSMTNGGPPATYACVWRRCCASTSTTFKSVVIVSSVHTTVILTDVGRERHNHLRLSTACNRRTGICPLDRRTQGGRVSRAYSW
jgi:hypothetical protein